MELNSKGRSVALVGVDRLWVHQRFEWGELAGFETRNKYGIKTDSGDTLGFVAEQQKGIFGFFFRQYLGHWRSYELHFFTTNREVFMIAKHPFRWFFRRFELRDGFDVRLGAIQKRFGIFSKKFDIEDPEGNVLMRVSSPFWRLWKFKFERDGQVVGIVTKRWTGMLAEAFTDKDRFLVEFTDSKLSQRDRQLLTASAIFIDMMYFEKKE